jgi:transposase
MDFHLDTLLNLPNVTVESCIYQNDEVYLILRFLTEGCSCPYCGGYSEALHQNRPVLIRDLSVFGRAIYLKVPRRQFYCSSCQRYFTEKLEFVDWLRRYTQRYEEYIYQRIKSSSIEQVSREERLSFEKVQGIFDQQHARKKKDDWGEVKRLSIDEISKRKGHQHFVTVVSDIDRGKLIEVIDSHKQSDIIEVLKQQPLEVREIVEEVSVDMWGGFPKVVKEVFPNASVVFDRFHVMKPVNEELNLIRKQVGVKDQGSKFILLKNGEDLNAEEKTKLAEILSRSKRLRSAYEWKEEFREIYEKSTTVEEGRIWLSEWLNKAQSVYCDAITMIRNHLEGICNYFINRTTSGAMEGINNRIKLIKRQAYGFVNFENFRARLLACFSD